MSIKRYRIKFPEVEAITVTKTNKEAVIAFTEGRAEYRFDTPPNPEEHYWGLFMNEDKIAQQYNISYKPAIGFEEGTTIIKLPNGAFEIVPFERLEREYREIGNAIPSDTKKYVVKSEEVEAIELHYGAKEEQIKQFTCGKAKRCGSNDWRIHKQGNDVVSTESTEVTEKLDKLTMYSGDILLKHPNGVLEIMSASRFMYRYQEIVKLKTYKRDKQQTRLFRNFESGKMPLMSRVQKWTEAGLLIEPELRERFREFDGEWEYYYYAHIYDIRDGKKERLYRCDIGRIPTLKQAYKTALAWIEDRYCLE